MTALIVDDTSILRKVLGGILQEYCSISKSSILEANDGVEGLEIYKQKKPNVVFLDVAMPNMGGKECVKQILEIDSSAKIIMCTAAADEQMVTDCMNAGAKAYLVKPLRPELVVAAIKKAGL